MSAPTAEVLYTTEFTQDPHAVFAHLREQAPVLHDPAHNRWWITRYHDVTEVFNDGARFSAAANGAKTGRVLGRSLIEMEGREHAHHRKIVQPEFVGKRLAALDGLIERNITELLDGFRERGEVDLVDEFSMRLPLNSITDLLGLDRKDHESLLHWYEAIVAGMFDDDLVDDGVAAHHALGGKVDELLDVPDRCPAHAVIAHVSRAEVDGMRLTRDEVKSFVSLLLVAGAETLDRALSSMWWNLLQSPDQLAAVRDDPELWDRAFSETMRKDPPGLFFPRVTTEPVTLGGIDIPANQVLMLVTGSANRDPEVFAHPDEFDLFRADLHMGLERRAAGFGRDADSAAGHLAFGAGAHFCLGYQLARTEAVTSSRLLMQTMGDPRLAGPPPPMEYSGNLRSPRSLRIAFTPRKTRPMEVR
jgi:cytochrome P450